MAGFGPELVIALSSHLLVLHHREGVQFGSLAHDTRETPGATPKRSPPRLIYCTVLARSAKLPTPPWPPAMRSIWMPIFWTPFTSAVVPGLAGGICGAGLQMSVTKPSFASGM